MSHKLPLPLNVAPATLDFVQVSPFTVNAVAARVPVFLIVIFVVLVLPGVRGEFVPPYLFIDAQTAVLVVDAAPSLLLQVTPPQTFLP